MNFYFMVIDAVLLLLTFCTFLLYCICVGWTWLLVCTCVVLGVVFILLCAFAVMVFAYVGKQKCVQVRGVQLNAEPIHGVCSPVIAALMNSDCGHCPLYPPQFHV